MRIAILQQKAESEGLDIPGDVLNYMAGLVQSNIRTLEGALIRLMAYSSMSGAAVTKELARDVLGGYFVGTLPFRRGKALPGDDDKCSGVVVAEADGGSASPGLRALALPGTVSRLGALQSSAREQFQEIIDAVAAPLLARRRFLSPGDGSAATSRRREIAGPRQIAIYLARERDSYPGDRARALLRRRQPFRRFPRPQKDDGADSNPIRRCSAQCRRSSASWKNSRSRAASILFSS